LVERNVGLVGSIARGYRDRGLDYHDLMQEGHLGLIRAIDKFDIAEGCKLSTYATYWIRESIVRALAANGSPFRLPSEKLGRIRKHQAVLRQGLHREPTSEEVAESLADDAMTAEDIRSVLDATRPASSMDIRVGDDGSCAISDLIADERVVDPASELIREELRELLDGILRGLSERERLIIESRFSRDGDCPDTLAHLGEQLGLTKERVRQLEAKALRSLRKTLLERGVDIGDFLAA
jgi:RNA polymerase primary sigma factor